MVTLRPPIAAHSFEREIHYPECNDHNPSPWSWCHSLSCISDRAQVLGGLFAFQSPSRIGSGPHSDNIQILCLNFPGPLFGFALSSGLENHKHQTDPLLRMRAACLLGYGFWVILQENTVKEDD